MEETGKKRKKYSPEFKITVMMKAMNRRDEMHPKTESFGVHY